jgi:hypothetical protein
LVSIIAGVLLASPAFAVYYVDTADTADLGYVADGGSIDWVHSFEPLEGVQSVDATHLVISVTEDFVCDSFGECVADVFFQKESVVFSINETPWDQGGDVTPSWFELGTVFSGDITLLADISEKGDSMTVHAESEGGDFLILASAMIVDFTPGLVNVAAGGGGASPMPEPSAALVFTLGGVIFSGGLRRRRQLRR